MRPTTDIVKTNKTTIYLLSALLCLATATLQSQAALVLQLAADDYSATTGTWTDTSGNNNHATQSTATYRPSLVADQTPNGSAVVRFDGVNDGFGLTTDITSSAADGFTVFFYGRPDAAASGSRPIVNGSTSRGSNASLIYYLGNGTLPSVGRRAAQFIGDADTALSTVEFSSINMRVNNAGSAFRLNGADDGTGGIPNSTFGPINFIGGGGTAFYGDVAEIRIYNSQLSAGEIAGVEAELNAAYVVPEPGGAIPEPATMCALGLAVAGLGGYVRKRRKA